MWNWLLPVGLPALGARHRADHGGSFASETESGLLVRAFGALSVSVNGDDVPIPKAKSRAVLAVLLIQRESLTSADSIIECVWGPDASSSRHALHVAMSPIRRAFRDRDWDGGSRLASTPAGYRLDLETDEFDVSIAEGLMRTARREVTKANLAAAESAYLAAESWFRSPPYSEFTYEEFAQPEIRRLTELAYCTMEERVAVQLEMGRHHDVVTELQGLVARYPTRERLLQYLMIAMSRSGRPADALESYEASRRVLDEEYGCPPSHDTSDLADRIRSGVSAS